VSNAYPRRVRAFRDGIIKQLKRVPNDRTSLEAIRAMSTGQLISAFVTWRMRCIPARPRIVGIWQGGVTPKEFEAARPKLLPLLEKVASGKDLTPHLSRLVESAGIVFPGARQAGQRQDIDGALNREGLHHFHVGGGGNPKGRSGALVFAEVLEKEFRIVALSNHQAFERGSTEQQRFFQISRRYMARDIPPGQAFMANPVMASGHRLDVMLFGRACEDQIERTDPLLDDAPYIDQLYACQEPMSGRQLHARPPTPLLAWHFEDLMFGVIEKHTRLFFSFFPFFAR
jgi:hypothetical protein